MAEAVEKLSRLGRVIAYDRRGCSRSERREPYERTRVADHADDAAALDLALRYPDRVRALAVLEGDAPRELAPRTAAWLDALAGRLDEVEEPGQLLIDAIYEPGTWAAIPDELRRILTENGAAIRAELRGEWWLDADAGALGGLRQPVLLVTANDSRAELREPTEALASVLPNARLARVSGGHLIDPASPEVLEFVGGLMAG